jgi:endonuclease/exonuclease/phosphatase family metal-dependent hydrolase
MNLKVLTYNIHKGYDWNKKNYFLHEVKNLVKASGAQIVLLQEVVGQNSQYKKMGLIESQYEFIADSIWTHFSYAKNAVHENGHHGNLILSEYPILKWQNLNISNYFLEQRGLLYCRIKLKKKLTLSIICLHLDLLNKGRLSQYKKVKNFIQSLKLPQNAPLIVAGDFNDWNQKASLVFEKELKMVEVHKKIFGEYAKTFPAAFPFLTLDRIYVRNLKVLNTCVMIQPGQPHFSDHLPLCCELQFGSNLNE